MTEEQSQKLFRLPGTIEEEEDYCPIDREAQQQRQQHQQHQRSDRPETPLLSHRNNVSILPAVAGQPRNATLLRVSTQSSSIVGIARQDSARSRFRAGPTRKLRRRAVLKSGECNVLQSRISRRSLRFLQDIFTTLVDTQWRWTLLCFALSFLLSWLIFAGIWWLIAFTHGDFDPRHQTDSWRPCVSDLHSFTSCFLFSIETQHTIGYGGRATTEECPEAIFVMCIQSISGVMIQAFMVGIVFAKMSRPKQRTQTLLFSKQAVICQRDGELCLMFRVGDMRKSHIIGATIRAQLIRSRTTKEGEILPHNQQELTVGADGQAECLFFIWPCIVVHKIDAESPFYNMSAEDMLTERFELVVILEGTIESTGQTTQARSSYLPQEVLWGHRFEPMVSYSKERQGYEVDYSLFNSTVQVDTPLCSGRELAEFYKLQNELRHQTSPDGAVILRKVPSGNLLDGHGLLLTIPSTPSTLQRSSNQQSFLIDEDLSESCQLTPHRCQRSSCRQHHQPYHQNVHRSELSLENDLLKLNQCCHLSPSGSCSRPSVPRSARKSEKKLARLLSRSLNATRRSCQDLNASKKYLLLALEGNLSGSYPSERFERSVIDRGHAGSRERLTSLPASNTSFPCDERPRLNLEEVVVHRLEESKDKVAARNRRSYENAQLQDVNGPVGGGSSSSSSDGSCWASSSSESEALVHRRQTIERPEEPPAFTSV